ncbi:acyl carrier protein [Micromonospora tarensis]|uniref:Acyl carrier protein n=1 Tax=Micromonospora tarensis TaxID=2806100 RepID=A0ABS1YAB6_9ACTN|nr:acyl carrier protein [Micromonospora tarensis]MBM0274305.1 acyl carrier protein [Micromonospora tarensis]
MNEELRSILLDDLGLEEAAVHPELSLEDAGFDSITLVELSVILLDRFGLEISEDELQDAGTVRDIDRLIERRRDHG